MARAAGDLDKLAAELAEVETWADTAPAERALTAQLPRGVGRAQGVAAAAAAAARAAAADQARVAEVEREAARQSEAVQAQV